ncbi:MULTISPECIES: hypothetical protein [Rhizobium/Agrobacterium group]|uniref:hypothetical protein n=1 Tax=Rhizobium/Agrobacterium group TaxID=227290 RepID=UPI001571C620|nr:MULTISPECIES: hypothetical protein [Rhizobium/Agrobacterium group]MCF1446654.1 hypothetical protein [Allorhizobium ampelinum]NSZ53502.1 hypothetical protein [Agrobacterium vitis]NTA32261.1 hypothetical protein [Agrobacterium vitis]
MTNAPKPSELLLLLMAAFAPFTRTGVPMNSATVIMVIEFLRQVSQAAREIEMATSNVVPFRPRAKSPQRPSPDGGDAA